MWALSGQIHLPLMGGPSVKCVTYIKQYVFYDILKKLSDIIAPLCNLQLQQVSSKSDRKQKILKDMKNNLPQSIQNKRQFIGL